MIRPIDTQILYPQTPELANRQQQTNQTVNIQQDTFAHAMKQEMIQKRESVEEANKEEKVENRHREQSKKEHKKGKNNKKENKPKKEETNPDKKSTIDIRI